MKHRFRSSPSNLFMAATLMSLLLSCSRLPLQSQSDPNTLRLASIEASDFPDFIRSLDAVDPVAPFYKDQATQRDCLDFFSALTGSEPIAKAILDNAERYQVPVTLAFALAFEESRFRTDAINHNGGSVDRGLFQLNSRSFPALAVQEFYDPELNARYGLAHLQYCLSIGGNEVAALAMYNAGRSSVDHGVTPRRTLDYVSRILKYEDNIGALFNAKVASKATNRVASAPGLALGLALGPVQN